MPHGSPELGEGLGFVKVAVHRLPEANRVPASVIASRRRPSSSAQARCRPTLTTVNGQRQTCEPTTHDDDRIGEWLRTRQDPAES
ncbi:hypothetical protein O9K51_05439 [Purpureocillium lavendulum]|uniref:Uncharacterized protein n=1 Tax=Purpureocillium lavendulum TaxID=1247861 RepID=A0AB34FSS0_9HYPO|nr:hypothetical protein O9K51_05439 [Purpureocillium lavendulum]